MKPETIAQLCHEVNRAYCAAIGDPSQEVWAQTPGNIQQSAINGVLYTLQTPEATPESQHENWCEFKRADGWVYGPEKDAAKKTHFCLVPYAELPEAQRVKDHLFRAVVLTAKDMD